MIYSTTFPGKTNFLNDNQHLHLYSRIKINSSYIQCFRELFYFLITTEIINDSIFTSGRKK